MLLLQFSTSHYCRKARLALGYKKISYTVNNLTPGIHALKIKPLTGLTTTPVLLPQLDGQPKAIGDSTQIFKFLEAYYPEPPLSPRDRHLDNEAWMLEDWLDESIGTATRFVYYDYRAGEGKSINPSFSSQMVIQIVRKQYGIVTPAVELAAPTSQNRDRCIRRTVANQALPGGRSAFGCRHYCLCPAESLIPNSPIPPKLLLAIRSHCRDPSHLWRTLATRVST